MGFYFVGGGEGERREWLLGNEKNRCVGRVFSEKFFLVDCSAELIGIYFPPLLLVCPFSFFFIPLWSIVEKYVTLVKAASRITYLSLAM